jgi:hypothetical protein
VDDVRSKVKPPTCHKGMVAVDGLKIQGAVMLTLVSTGMLLKLPESLVTKELFHVDTCVAALRLVLSNVTTPPKVMSPVMGVACACWQKRPQLSRPTATTVRIVLLRFFIIIALVVLVYPND